MFDVFEKKQTYDSVITGKENVSKYWNCIISMFLSFNINFVFGYACFMCICLKTATWLFMACFGTRFGFFLVKSGWQPCFCVHSILSVLRLGLDYLDNGKPINPEFFRYLISG